MFHYVGSTDWPVERINLHWSGTDRGHDLKSQWIRELKTRKQRLQMVVLEMTTRAKRARMEELWTRFLFDNGHPLTNQRSP